MGEVQDAYRGVRERVTTLAVTAGAAALDAPAPATPEWRVRDVLAHMVGVTCDVIEGRLEGVTSEAWTGAQVAARRDRPVADLLAEWQDFGPRFEEALDAFGWQSTAGQAVFDAATHEHDLRHALGAPGARDSAAVELAWRWLVWARGVGKGPVLRFVTEFGTVTSGDGEPVATIEASRFELFRAVTGRRTAGEVAAYGWDPAPKPELVLAAPFFHMREQSLGE